MSAIRNISETADSFVPSLGSTEDEPTMYRCRNCGRDADPDSDECPNCSSRNLRPFYV